MERFEQITNPVGEPNFEFQFEDVAPQGQNQDQKSEFSPDGPSPELTPKTSQSVSIPEFSADDFVASSQNQSTLPNNSNLTPSEPEVGGSALPNADSDIAAQTVSDDASF